MERKADVRGKEREGDNWPTGSHHTVGCAQFGPLGNLVPFHCCGYMRTHLGITSNMLTAAHYRSTV